MCGDADAVVPWREDAIIGRPVQLPAAPIRAGFAVDHAVISLGYRHQRADWRHLLPGAVFSFGFQPEVPVKYQILWGAFWFAFQGQTGWGYIPGGKTQVFLWVGQKGYSHHDSQNNRRQNHPESGLFVVHHPFYPFFHPHLPKGQGTGGDPAAGNAAIQERRGIGPAVVQLHFPDDLFVAGRLNIPAQKDVGSPHHRVEPVYAEQGKAQGLPPVVASANVGLLMSNDIGCILRCHAGGQVDHRADQPQNKGRIDEFTALDILFNRNGGRYPAVDQQEADQCVQKHPCRSDGPDTGKEEGQDLRGIGADSGAYRGQRGFQQGIDRVIDHGHAALDFRVRRVDDIAGQRFGGRDQTQNAFQGKRANEPEGNHSPEDTEKPFGSLPEHQPQGNHRKNQIGSGDAHIDQL